MKLLEMEEGEEYWSLRLVRGRGNSLETAGLEQLRNCFERAQAAGAPPLLLSSSSRSFCTGLDLEVTRQLDRDGMRRLMQRLHRALAACFTYPGPTVAALGGSTLAGGALLALACDRRVMAMGEARVGIHGVTLGIVYPDVAIEIGRHRLARRNLEWVLYRGLLMGDREALRRGLIDELVEADRLEPSAVEWLRAARGSDGRVFAAQKARVQRAAAARLADIDEGGMERWLDRWFHPDTQAALEAAREERREKSRERPDPPGSATT